MNILFGPTNLISYIQKVLKKYNIMEKLINNPFKVTFGLVSLIVGAITGNAVFFFFFGYAFGDILFSDHGE
jgi:hypothetical protein